MSILKKEYRYVFLFPGPVGFLLATTLKRSGADTLVVMHPRVKFPDAPAILGATVYLPDVFLRDMIDSGLPEPQLGRRENLLLYIGGVKILIDPDKTRQILELAEALPSLDTKLMKLLERLDGYYIRHFERLVNWYGFSSGKGEMGRNLMKGGLLPSLFAKRPLAGIPDDGDGLIAHWAVALPGYLSLGLLGPSAGSRALAAGFGLRNPHFCSIDARRLNLDAEYLYMNTGGDFIEVEGDKPIEVAFTGGAQGTLMADGNMVHFSKTLISKDIAAKVFIGHEELYAMLHGLTLLSKSFNWVPPPRFDRSQPAHGLILDDPMRPPVNDNLVMYSINWDDAETPTVSIAVTIERSEILLKHFAGRRHDHLVARMAGNFMCAVGGELSLQGDLAESPAPALNVHGKGSFRFYGGNLIPGHSLEDLARRARWLARQPDITHL